MLLYAVDKDCLNFFSTFLRIGSVHSFTSFVQTWWNVCADSNDHATTSQSSDFDKKDERFANNSHDTATGFTETLFSFSLFFS